MVFAVIAGALLLLACAEAIGAVRDWRRLRRATSVEPIDHVTGLRTGSVLNGLLVTMWARADREGGEVTVEVLELQGGSPDDYGIEVAKLVGPGVHVLRLSQWRFVIVRWLEAQTGTQERLVQRSVLRPGITATTYSSADHEAADVASRVLRTDQSTNATASRVSGGERP